MPSKHAMISYRVQFYFDQCIQLNLIDICSKLLDLIHEIRKRVNDVESNNEQKDFSSFTILQIQPFS